MTAALTIRMALREWKAHPGTLAFFALSVALGVACLVSTETLAVTMSNQFHAEGRSLLGGDIEVRSRKRFSPLLEATLKEFAERDGVAVVRTVETLSMIATSDRKKTRLCSLKAVSPGYPLHGTIVTRPVEAWSSFGQPGRVLVAPALRIQLGVEAGDELRAGNSAVIVAGELEAEPDQLAEPFRLGPRLMLRLEDLQRTGLLVKGSRATYRALLLAPSPSRLPDLVRRLEKLAETEELRITTADEGPEGSRRLLSRITTFLNLVGLAVMLLAGVGTAMAVHTYVGQRLDMLAILKCLGARGPGLVGLMLVQTLLLAGGGVLAGAAAGTLLAMKLPVLVSGTLPFEIQIGFEPWVIFRGVAVGLLVTLGFCLHPLMGLRHLSALQVFRRDHDPRGVRDRRRDPQSLAILGLLLAMVTGLAWDRAGSGQLAAYFLGGFGFAILLLVAASRAILWILPRIASPGGFSLRQALKNLHRPGNQSTSVIVAVGLGVFLVSAIRTLDGSILEELSLGLRGDAPNLFIIDIQPDQRDDVVVTLEKNGHPPAEVVPLVRSKLSRINGKSIRELYPDLTQAPWWITKDYWLSYRSALSPTEQIVDGRLWTGPVSRRPTEVSVEERTSGRFNLDVGGELTVNVSGLEVPARVTSIRRVRWSSMRPNFFLLFPEGVLNQAPHTYFAVTRVPALEDRESISRDLVALHPNLTVIDFTGAVESLRKVLERASWVIYLVASLCLAGGGLVLAASVLLTRRHRLHELALLKLLGARRRILIQILALEYALLGSIGGLFGSLAAVVLSRTVAVEIFELPPPAGLASVLGATLLAGAFSVVCGSLASVGLLGQPPAEILRSE